jgi:hypothetical protein
MSSFANTPYVPPKYVPKEYILIPGNQGFYYDEVGEEIWRYRDRSTEMYGRIYPSGWHLVRPQIYYSLAKNDYSSYPNSLSLKQIKQICGCFPEEDRKDQ